MQGEADKRIKKCNEVLQSMKLIKLYAWEDIFRRSILATRSTEIRQLLTAAICRIFARKFSFTILQTALELSLFIIVESTCDDVHGKQALNKCHQTRLGDGF